MKSRTIKYLHDQATRANQYNFHKGKNKLLWSIRILSTQRILIANKIKLSTKLWIKENWLHNVLGLFKNL